MPEVGILLAYLPGDCDQALREATMTLVCKLCKIVQGDIYRICVPGMDDLVMCNHVVESVVETYRLVAAPTMERISKAA